MEKLNELSVEYVEYMPEKKEHGILYISHRFELAIHLCACGCGVESVTPFSREHKGWTLAENNGKVTLKPSIGNFSGERPYHAHYFITDNKIR